MTAEANAASVAAAVLGIVLRYSVSLQKAYAMALEKLRARPSKESYMLSYKLLTEYHRLQYAFQRLRHRPGRPKELVELLVTGKYLEVPLPEDPVKRVAVERSYPLWLVRRLSSYMSLDELDKMLQSLNERHVWLLCLVEPERVVEELSEEGVEARVDRDLSYMVEVLKLDKPPSRLNVVRRGAAFPLDKASALVVEALSAAGCLVLDACAAPCVKSSLLVLRGSTIVVAVDKSWRRLKEASKILRMLGAEGAVMRIHADSRMPPLRSTFRKALVDAPCTGSGTVGDDPSVKVRLSKPSKVRYYHDLQVELLKAVAELSEEVVYATCSLLPEEGEQVVEESGLEPLPLDLPSTAPCYPGFRCSGYARRTYPHMHRCSAFFIAKLRRRNA